MCAISGEEFEQLSSSEKETAARNYQVFARFLPAQKKQLVEIFRKDNTVGFLGDGINDAPALKAAHVGIVVQHASDLTKEAADLILGRKSLLAIVDGIAIGRTVFANTIKYITTTITSNFGNFYSIALASLFINFLPLLPRQILLINFLSDLPMVGLATDTVDQSLLKVPTRFSVKDIAFVATVLGIVSSVFDFMFFAFFYRSEPALLQTCWFLESLLTEIVLIFSLRTRLPFYRAQRPSIPLLLLCLNSILIAYAFAVTSVGERLFHFTMPSWHDAGIIVSIVVCYFVVTDLCKLAFYGFLNNSKSEKRT